MAASSLNLKINTSLIAPCDGLELIDTTGNFNAITNPFGYGFGGGSGVSINDVTQLEIKVTYNSLGVYVLYTFTISNGEVVGATLIYNGAPYVIIFDNLDDYTFPFTEANPFNLTKDYGVDIPKFDDDVFKIEYTISGENPDEEQFELTALYYLAVGCNAKCCISKKFVKADLNCSCNSKANTDLLYIESLYNQFIKATDAGSLAQGLNALRELQKLCGSTNCGC